MGGSSSPNDTTRDRQAIPLQKTNPGHSTVRGLFTTAAIKRLERADRYQACCWSTRQPASADYGDTILHCVCTRARSILTHTVPVAHKELANTSNPCPALWQSGFRDCVCAFIWNPKSQVACRRVVDVRANQVRRTRWIVACDSAILALRCDSIIRWQINRWTAQLAAISGIPLLPNQRIVWAHTIYLARKNDW